MKKILSLFSFLLVAAWSYAENSFSVDDLNIKPGEEKTISVSLTNEEDAKSAAIDITLPTGLSFAGTNGDVVFADRTSGMMSKSAKIQNSGALRVGMAFGTIPAGEGEVFTFKVKADANATLGSAKISYTGMSLTYASKVTIPDMESEVNIYQTYKVTVAANDAAMGTVEGGNDEAMSNSQITVKATANEGYEFVNWKKGPQPSTLSR